LEPVTQLAFSAAIARTGINRLSPMATAAVLIAGVLPEIDVLSAIAGPHAFFLLHRTVTHSILGATILAVLVAFLLWRSGRKREWNRPKFPALLIAALCGAAGNLALSLGDTFGEKLFWPFSSKWYVLNLWPQLDPWMLALLALVLGLPWLLAVVGEEMGAPRKHGVSIMGIVALVLVAAYCGMRAELRSQAIVELYSYSYHGAKPDRVGAFPTPISPFDWRGVVDTYNAIDVLPAPLGPNADFQPNMAFTNYKVEDSAGLKAAEKAPGMAGWRNFAIFPFAAIQDTETGQEATFRDVRFSQTGQFLMDPVVTVDLDTNNKVTKVTWHLGPPH
jgi:membrane-bound metal-dependent hydrolase YbcI (DUF457 family)